MLKCFILGDLFEEMLGRSAAKHSARYARRHLRVQILLHQLHNGELGVVYTLACEAQQLGNHPCRFFVSCVFIARMELEQFENGESCFIGAG